MKKQKQAIEKKEEVIIINRAMDGNRDAFAMLVNKYYDYVYKIAWKFSLNQEDAEDIAQNVIIKLAKNLSKYRFEAAFSTWLYRLTINVAKDFLRSKNKSKRRELPILEEVISTQDSNQEKQLEIKELLKEINRLPEPQKEAVILVYWEGYSHKEAAEILNCAETTISWRLYEARRRLGRFADGDSK